MKATGKNIGALAVTADLATSLNASVIGIAARQPLQPIGDVPYSGEVAEADMAEIRKETSGGALLGETRHTDIGDPMMQAGR